MLLFIFTCISIKFLDSSVGWCKKTFIAIKKQYHHSYHPSPCQKMPKANGNEIRANALMLFIIFSSLGNKKFNAFNSLSHSPSKKRLQSTTIKVGNETIAIDCRFYLTASKIFPWNHFSESIVTNLNEKSIIFLLWNTKFSWIPISFVPSAKKICAAFVKRRNTI